MSYEGMSVAHESSMLEPSELLAAVEASPAAVARHDRQTWVGLFAATGEVNDPVGSTPHVGAGAIGRFFDTFIAPNTIEFDVEHDVVAGMTVLRDLTVRTTMPTGVTMYIPMHLRYDLVNEGDPAALKIARLFAHWELKPMILQLLMLGRGGLLAVTGLGPQLVIKQGIGGALGFCKGFRGVREPGKHRVRELVAALSSSDLGAASALLAPDATLSPDGVRDVGVAEFVHAARGVTVDKLLASGRSVTATIRLGESRGVGLFEFGGNSAGPRSISTVRLYF